MEDSTFQELKNQVTDNILEYSQNLSLDLNERKIKAFKITKNLDNGVTFHFERYTKFLNVDIYDNEIYFNLYEENCDKCNYKKIEKENVIMEVINFWFLG